MEQRLESLYQKVMELEKFAESKNSLLLTFIGVILLLIYNIFGAEFFSSARIIYASPVFGALIIILFSFLPYRDSQPDRNAGKTSYPLEKLQDSF